MYHSHRRAGRGAAALGLAAMLTPGLAAAPVPAPGVAAGPPPGATPAAVAPTALLARGTPVRVRLETPLRAGRCKAGDPVAFTVAQDVFGPGGARLLAAGAAGVGRVTDSAGHHSLGRAGRLAFTCDAVTGGGGRRVPLLLSVRPDPPGRPATAPPPPSVPAPNDLHTPSPVAGDLLAGTPLALSGQTTRSTSGTFTLGVGADPSADAGVEYESRVSADTLVPVLPAPPPRPPAPQPGVVLTITKRPDGILVLRPPPVGTPAPAAGR